jgi:hypothetical protein
MPKRGAPPGNHNALKHGFYSAHFKQAEGRILSRMSVADLTAEIEVMRIGTRRFLEAQAALPPGALDFEAQLSALRAITLGVESINRLVRATVFIAHSAAGESQRVVAEIEAGFEDFRKELDSGAEELFPIVPQKP